MEWFVIQQMLTGSTVCEREVYEMSSIDISKEMCIIT